MSIEASAYVWKHSKQSGTRLLLLVAIADYTNAEGWAWPSIASLCQRTRMGERYVQKMLREIQADGELEIKERPNASNFYRVVMGVNNSSPVNNSSGAGERGFTPRVNGGSPKPLIEPIMEPSNTPQAPKGAEVDASIKTKCNLGDGFEAFWKEYPKKKSKDAALRAWKRKQCARIVEEVMLGLAVAISSHQWTKKNGQFIPHPATWLNAGGWQDEAPEAPAALARKPQPGVAF